VWTPAGPDPAKLRDQRGGEGARRALREDASLRCPLGRDIADRVHAAEPGLERGWIHGHVAVLGHAAFQDHVGRLLLRHTQEEVAGQLGAVVEHENGARAIERAHLAAADEANVALGERGYQSRRRLGRGWHRRRERQDEADLAVAADVVPRAGVGPIYRARRRRFASRTHPARARATSTAIKPARSRATAKTNTAPEFVKSSPGADAWCPQCVGSDIANTRPPSTAGPNAANSTQRALDFLTTTSPITVANCTAGTSSQGLTTPPRCPDHQTYAESSRSQRVSRAPRRATHVDERLPLAGERNKPGAKVGAP
jgi:phage terminase Nu1 subunit (DNA packaging protein)